MFGFGLEKDKTIDVIESAQRIVNHEIIDIEEVKTQLIYELKELEHLKNNLKILRSNFESIRKLFDIKEKTVLRISRESINNSAELDIQKIKDMFDSLTDIDAKLLPLVRITHAEASRLTIEDTHVIYAEEKNQKKMKEIDSESKDMISELQLIISKNNSLNEKATEIGAKIHTLARSKYLDSIEPKSKEIGFR